MSLPAPHSTTVSCPCRCLCALPLQGSRDGGAAAAGIKAADSMSESMFSGAEVNTPVSSHRGAALFPIARQYIQPRSLLGRHTSPPFAARHAHTFVRRCGMSGGALVTVPWLLPPPLAGKTPVPTRRVSKGATPAPRLSVHTSSSIVDGSRRHSIASTATKTGGAQPPAGPCAAQPPPLFMHFPRAHRRRMCFNAVKRHQIPAPSLID
jgi:hypothetical protein